ncbi:MAG TPA: hypothetical protein VK186_14325 [Candidatus Deferrimicrobium sp.]|nr:hypothetical protein [Candidatus Deferrimicrobium sp.]
MSDVIVTNACPDATWGIVENGSSPGESSIVNIDPERQRTVNQDQLANPKILPIKLLKGDPQDPYYQINGGPKPPIILDSNNEFSILLSSGWTDPINVTIGDGQS